jgi:hypothetical protein
LAMMHGHHQRSSPPWCGPFEECATTTKQRRWLRSSSWMLNWISVD